MFLFTRFGGDRVKKNIGSEERGGCLTEVLNRQQVCWFARVSLRIFQMVMLRGIGQVPQSLL